MKTDLLPLKIEPKTGKPTVLISIEDISKAFGNNKVLNHFSLKISRGETIVILGKSGSGKSVLIKCLIGLITPDTGSIKIFDENITELKHERLDKIRARIGFLFQSNALYDSMTVRENLEFPLRRHWIQISQEEVNKIIANALEDVGLSHTISMMPAELSGGMRKRIALARTLILQPEIILYDEPTTGLDPITSKEIISLMQELQVKYQTTSIIISHDINCVKMQGAKIVMLIDGTCYAEDYYENLIKSSDPKISQFFE